MGIANFFMWISERYPCLTQTVTEHQIPEFDNLYLDMNGIIHECSHPNDEDVHFRITEQQITLHIFHYLEVLFRLIRPQKLFFIAIDGVVPRAKMNQQRGRRFYSAREAEYIEKEALRKGEVLPNKKRFDSNCITPGTEFMDNLQKQLQFFVTRKVSTDPLWQKTQIILSGHQVPGEGEHKIMEFIRFQRSQPEYNAETRHCFYGLDADLIMLGLCSHEPYITLIRKEVQFSGQPKKITTPEETTFQLLHLSLLREYLDLEFTSVKPKLRFPYDLEKIIDDWVLMGFFVGNDFIPNLPGFQVNTGVLPIIFSAYMEVLPTLNGYINEQGQLNLPRFEKFLTRLAVIDYDNYVKRLEHPHGRKLVKCEAKPLVTERPHCTSGVLTTKDAGTKDNSVNSDQMIAEKLVKESEPELEEYTSSFIEDEEFKAYKKKHYIDKMKYKKVDRDVLHAQAEGYVLAIQWILHYYYNGVCSWSWFHPHHYAPYVSDVRDFANFNLEYDLGQPFLPFEQQLGVLPEASKALVPITYHQIMSSKNSPISDLYPSYFHTDLNGAKKKWQAVVLVPFIDEKRLIIAMKDCESRLTENEKSRNRHGPMQVYEYCEEDLGESVAPAFFLSIPHNHCQIKEITRNAFVISSDLLVKGLHPNYNPNHYISGFPSMRTLPFTGTLEKSSICVFNKNTPNESQVLALCPETMPDIKDISKRYCGKTVFVSWPHLQEARIVAVANIEVKFSIESFGKNDVASKLDGEIRQMPMMQRDVDDWRLQEKEISTQYANRWGVDIGTTRLLVYAAPIIGRKYVYTQNDRVTSEKQWSPNPVPYAFQATVKELQIKETFDHQFSTLAEIFTPDRICFMLGYPGYGLQGKVLPAEKKFKVQEGISIEFDNIHEPDMNEVKQRFSQLRYMSSYDGAKELNISSDLISRITGNIYLLSNLTEKKENSDKRKQVKPRIPEKVNVGLSLKFNTSKKEILGWSKKVDNGWLYSSKTIQLLKIYIAEFPDFFECLSKYPNSCEFTDSEAFGENGIERANKLREFVRRIPCKSADRNVWGSEEIDVIALSYLAKLDTDKKYVKPLLDSSVMQVLPHLLCKPDLMTRFTLPDPSVQFKLLDRVVNIRQGYSVPFGLRGTIVGIKNALKVMNAVYEILFDEEFVDALPIKGLPDLPNRVYSLPAWAIINLTHGLRKHTEQGKPMAVVHLSGSAGTQSILKRKIEEINPVVAAPETASLPPTPSNSVSKKKKMDEEKVQDDESMPVVLAEATGLA